MIEVVAGLMFNEEGKVLIARRAPHKSLPGNWEFPGGKIEDNESPEISLERELLEEFEIQTKTGKCFGVNEHDYGSFKIRLSFYQSIFVSGKWKLSDHDKIEWVDIDSLNKYEMAEADVPIIKELLKTGNT